MDPTLVDEPIALAQSNAALPEEPEPETEAKCKKRSTEDAMLNSETSGSAACAKKQKLLSSITVERKEESETNGDKFEVRIKSRHGDVREFNALVSAGNDVNGTVCSLYGDAYKVIDVVYACDTVEQNTTFGDIGAEDGAVIYATVALKPSDSDWPVNTHLTPNGIRTKLNEGSLDEISGELGLLGIEFDPAQMREFFACVANMVHADHSVLVFADGSAMTSNRKSTEKLRSTKQHCYCGLALEKRPYAPNWQYNGAGCDSQTCNHAPIWGKEQSCDFLLKKEFVRLNKTKRHFAHIYYCPQCDDKQFCPACVEEDWDVGGVVDGQ